MDDRYLSSKKVSKKKKTETSSLNKKLVYSVLLLTPICLAIILGYYFLVMPYSGRFLGAAIVDQLSFDENLINNEFVTKCTFLFNTSGFNVEYHEGNIVDIKFYSNLPSKGGKILILRAHSSILTGSNLINIFTSEPFDEALAYGSYQGLIDHISKAVFDVQPPPDNEYFAIKPSFVSDVMKDRFSDSLVVLMGCAGLNQTTMAEALVNKGARVVIGWTRNIDLGDTDSSTLELLEYLLAEDPWTVDAAVRKINERIHSHNSTLDYYPKDYETQMYKIPKGEKSNLMINEISSLLNFIVAASWRHDERVALSLKSARRYS